MLTKKEDIFRKIYSDPAFSSTFNRLKDPQEKARALATVEHVVGSLFDALIPSVAAMHQDPAAASRISEALKTGDGIIKESDGSPIASGSRG
jgi:hypothetical protein